ncbi:MAG: GFA family protein [Gammaproteobacteria bacterium]|nr:GFA family protein [Gammaproteobacteria bacterium]MYD75306.1 GFA family protein [Gammaproteobacteria bacterium]MYJ51499.1 GFA family protein [Gammaproteobacteria bacterium]
MPLLSYTIALFHSTFAEKEHSMHDTPFATGCCRCGRIKISISDKPVMSSQCHCKDCQRLSGTGHFSLAFFEEESVTITGEAKGYTVITDRGNRNTRYFCPECGSRMYGINTGRPGKIAVPVGCLDDHSWYQPDVVVYTRMREDWDITRTDIPNFEEMPPPPPDSPTA